MSAKEIDKESYYVLTTFYFAAKSCALILAVFGAVGGSKTTSKVPGRQSTAC